MSWYRDYKEQWKGIYDQMSNDQRERFRKIDSADGFNKLFNIDPDNP